MSPQRSLRRADTPLICRFIFQRHALIMPPVIAGGRLIATPIAAVAATRPAPAATLLPPRRLRYEVRRVVISYACFRRCRARLSPITMPRATPRRFRYYVMPASYAAFAAALFAARAAAGSPPRAAAAATDM